jgi:hypothetical protein
MNVVLRAEITLLFLFMKGRPILILSHTVLSMISNTSF